MEKVYKPKTVSFFKNQSGGITGELLSWHRGNSPIVTGRTFEEAIQKAQKAYGRFAHARDCECDDCN